MAECGNIALGLLWRQAETRDRRTDSPYLLLEPFAGMAGVLFARQPVKPEVMNDLNQRVINWRRIVRDQPENFGRLVEMPPIPRVKYQWALMAGR